MSRYFITISIPSAHDTDEDARQHATELLKNLPDGAAVTAITQNEWGSVEERTVEP